MRCDVLKALCAKCLRMALVFVLAFASTLGVERAALGVGASVPEGSVVNLRVYEVDAKAKDQRGALVRDALALAEDPKAKQGYVPALENTGDATRFLVMAVLADEEDEVDVSDMVTWKSSDSKTATVSEEGMVTARKASTRPVDITCSVKPGYADRLDGRFASRYPDGLPELSFSLNVAAPYVTSVEILRSDASAFTDSRTLTLEAGADSYAFQASVHIHAQPPQTCICTKDKGLSEQTEGMLEDLVWTVSGSDKASIEDGVLKMNGAKSVTVRCSSPNAAPGAQEPSDSIKVNPSDEDDAYVESLEIRDKDGASFGKDKVLAPTAADMPYQFHAAVRLVEADGTATDYSFDGDSWRAAGEETEVPFKLAWTLSASGSASLSESGLLDMDASTAATVRCSCTMGKDGRLVEDSVVINPVAADKLAVHLQYTPVPEGQYAYITTLLAGIDPITDDTSEVTYQIYWEESQDGGATWTLTDSATTEPQTLRRPTAEPYLGRLYRARIVILNDPDHRAHGSEATSAPVELVVGEDGLSVQLLYDNTAVGEQALFETIVSGAGSSETLVYTWEESDSTGVEWKTLAEGYLPTYAVLTERSRYLHRFRVWVTTSDGERAVSNIQTLSSKTGADPTASGDDENGTGGQTLSDIADETGGVRIDLGKGKTGTLKPAGTLSVSDDADEGDDAGLSIDANVNEKIAQQKAEQQEQINATQPGARWNPVYTLNEQPDPADLESNPFALLVAPFCLACLAAGVVEKLAKYRMQKRT